MNIDYYFIIRSPARVRDNNRGRNWSSPVKSRQYDFVYKNRHARDVHLVWTVDGWKTRHEQKMKPAGKGVFEATARLRARAQKEPLKMVHASRMRLVPRKLMKKEAEQKKLPEAPRKEAVKKHRVRKAQKKFIPYRAEFDRFLYQLLPAQYRRVLEQEAGYALIAKPIPNYTVLILKNMLALAGALVVLSSIFLDFSGAFLAVMLASGIILAAATPYIVYTLKAESRRRAIERVLPDALRLTASNIKSGFTIDKALLFSARPEFGVLADELRRAAFRLYSGVELQRVFMDMSARVKSENFEHITKLLLEGIRAGGDVSTLLEESAADMEHGQMLRKEIRSSVRMYVIFIVLAGVIGAPVMFAISNYLIASSAVMWSGIGSVGSAAMGSTFIPLSPGAPSVSAAFFSRFALAAIFITTLFAGFTVSLVQTGRMDNSIRYSPVFMFFGIGLFILARHAMSVLMGTVLI